MSSNTVFKTDDTGAFGNQFITIKFKNPRLYPVSKILVVVNGGVCIPPKEFTDENNFQIEETTLNVNFVSNETAKFNAANVVNLVAYDMQGLQYTCRQSFTFYAQNGVIIKNGCC